MVGAEKSAPADARAPSSAALSRRSAATSLKESGVKFQEELEGKGQDNHHHEGLRPGGYAFGLGLGSFSVFTKMAHFLPKKVHGNSFFGK